MEAGAFGDAAGDDGRNGGGEGEQEEELHHLVAALLGQHFGAVEEVSAVGHGVADEKVGDGRDTEIGQDLDQCIDLVLLADGAEFKKGEARVHGQNHDGPEQDEEGVAGVVGLLHFGLQNRSEAPSRCRASSCWLKSCFELEACDYRGSVLTHQSSAWPACSHQISAHAAAACMGRCMRGAVCPVPVVCITRRSRRRCGPGRPGG